jgi:hypothetical protein
MKILVNFDIKDERPYKSVRIYDASGLALGAGEIVVNKAPESASLFSEEPGYVTYLVEFDLSKAVGSENDKIKLNSKKKTSPEFDVEKTDDEAEDTWVRGAYQQAIDAKVKVGLGTIQELREDYRKMKQKYKEVKDDTLNYEVEEITAGFTSPLDEIEVAIPERYPEPTDEQRKKELDAFVRKNLDTAKARIDASVAKEKETTTSLDDLMKDL